ncbi:MAG: IS5 family transposase [Patescibacteria group bacterium]|nr:IS5 family transposase [Patescibacteria group bacterium]
MSFETGFIALGQQKKLRCEKFLNEMNKVIPWKEFLAKIQPYYEREEKIAGRPKKDCLAMLKIYFLQQWYNLSDPAAEEAIYDRISFQKFLDIDLLADEIPDETTILRFRHLLEKRKLPKKFLEIVNHILVDKGIMLKNGTIVDASIIIAPSSTKNESKKRDPEMSSTKKGSNYYFGMKTHIGVDSSSGLVHSVENTTASVSDKKMAEDLFHGEEKAKFGDKGYYSEEEKRQAREDGIFWGILDRGKINHPLSSSQKKRNKKLSSVRAKVEHPFQVIKCQWHHTKVRYKGLFKNSMQFNTLFALSNLFMSRKYLLDTI